MILERWMRQVGLNVEDVARLTGTRPDAVRKWLKRQKIPTKEHMEAIFRVTRGRVDPRDFYDLPGLADFNGGDRCPHCGRRLDIDDSAATETVAHHVAAE